jgi:hypothetical protein
MKLTRKIFDKWKISKTIPKDTLDYALTYRESLGFCDWYIMDFWYCLNHDWYKMNNKMFAYTGCDKPYVEPRDFDDYEEYWSEK